VFEGNQGMVVGGEEVFGWKKEVDERLLLIYLQDVSVA
jgi:hypothetical protein